VTPIKHGAEGVCEHWGLRREGRNQWEKPGACDGIRTHGVMEWGPDDPTKALDLCADMLYRRVSGLTWEERRTADSARVALEGLLGSSDTPPLSDTKGSPKAVPPDT